MKKTITVLTFCAVLFALNGSVEAQQRRRSTELVIYPQRIGPLIPLVPREFG